MKTLNYLSCVLTLLLTSCSGTQTEIGERSRPLPCAETAVSKETAVLIAKGDASQAYTLSAYDIRTYEQSTAWRVVFELKEPGVDGGGPDYLIDKETGKILSATYYK